MKIETTTTSVSIVRRNRGSAGWYLRVENMRQFIVDGVEIFCFQDRAEKAFQNGRYEKKVISR